MMRKAGLTMAALGLAGVGSYAAIAESTPQDRDPFLAMNKVLVANGCSNCHAADYVRVGPAMTDIATLYASATPDEIAAMRHNIAAGIKGKWGTAVMPVQQHVTPERAAEIATAIMALSKHRTQ